MRNGTGTSAPTAPEVIDTERLILRALRPGHGAALAELIQSNRARLEDSFPKSVAEVKDPAGGEAVIARTTAEWLAREGFWYGIVHREQDTLIGRVQLKRVDWEVGKAELGYLIDARFEGQGLMSEALEALLRMGFAELGLRKVFLRAIVGNARSVALARRFGFTREGTLRQEFRTFDGAIVDLDYYGLLAEDIAPLRRPE